MTDTMTIRDVLTAAHACQDALDWLGDRDLDTAWRECERGDWMLWACATVGVDHRLIVRAACACARQALQYVPVGEDRPRIAIETAEQWCEGGATKYEARAAAYDAAAEASYAALAAAEASYAALASAEAAYAAAEAAYAAAHAAAKAAAYAAAAAATHTRQESLHRAAEIVRSIIPIDAVREAAGGGDGS